MRYSLYFSLLAGNLAEKSSLGTASTAIQSVVSFYLSINYDSVEMPSFAVVNRRVRRNQNRPEILGEGNEAELHGAFSRAYRVVEFSKHKLKPGVRMGLDPPPISHMCRVAQLSRLFRLFKIQISMGHAR